nr:ATP-dependent RNA helicase [Ipomoea batatas]
MMEKKDADSVMPIIGLYVAAASALCFIAMLLNLVNNLSGKFFSLNATWLTILAVATKLTGDLTTPMFPGDNLSKGNSTVLLTLAMAIKKRTESKYQKLAASDEKQMERHTVEELRLSITKYWVMAASGSPPSLMKSNQVPRLLSGEPPNCWTLPVVTLTSIAIAIPNIASEHVDWLVSSVNEGLRYASLIDVLGEKRGLKSIKNAADVVWVGVELHRKWIDMDLERKIGDTSSTKDIIQDLADVAERIVMEFSSKDNIILVENPLYWPSNVLAANSMYRITRTIMLYYENNEYQAEELFRKLICMIADILAACLTNLPHMITTKCISNAIEERLESVRDGAIIFGETEDILKFFEEHKLSSVVPSQPLCIDEWCGWIEQQATTVSSSTTSNGASS